jgi:glycosyltransferase involved in cell wall biosynthesis
VDFLHQIFPSAEVYTLVVDSAWQSKYQTWQIHTSWLQWFYNRLPKLQYWLVLIPWAINSLKINAEIIISSSSSFAKNLRPGPGATHICFCHTPARFLWEERESYVKQEVPVFLRPVVNLFLTLMKRWDLNGTKRVKYFIANSREVQKRIFNTYHRPAEVVYPCVDTNFWQPTQAKQNNFFMAGRLQEHKNFFEIIQIFNKLGLPLRIAGTGRQEEYLKSIAKPNIQFLGRIDDEALRDEYSRAIAFIYPQKEDFGLMPIEAACCGTPTIARSTAGSLETVKDQLTGMYFSGDFLELETLLTNWDIAHFKQTELINWGQQFNFEKFKQQILNIVAQNIHENFS